MGSTSPSPLNAVYYPSWAVYEDLPPSKLQADSITHIFYAFAGLDHRGSLTFQDKWIDDQMPVDGERGCLRALAKLKKQHPHLTTILSIGGGSGGHLFPAIAASARSRVAFATAAREFVDTYSLDGVDLDWEHPSDPVEGANFVHLLKMLRAHLPEYEYIVTAALPASSLYLRHIDIPAASILLDYLNLMGYDLAGPWSDLSGHHAQLLPPPSDTPLVGPRLWGSCHPGIDYAIRKGCPRRKLLLGVPAYARYFPGANGPGQPFDRARSGELRYSELPEKWIARATVDPDLGAASFVDDRRGGLGFVTFDVPSTVRQKAGYVNAMGLAGLFFWTGIGDVNGANSLVAAGQKGLDEL